jgi:SOS-response transcriptional repressor LexA
MNIKCIRRENLRTLAKTVGGISRLADRLNKTQSQISHLIGSKPVKNIGDKIAAQAEREFKKPSGWLDRQHGFIELGSGFYGAGQQSQKGVLCLRVPLISWKEAKNWHQIAYNYKPESAADLIPVTIKVSSFAFALRVYGDSMESAGGVSFTEGAVIIIEPDQVPVSGSFVVVSVTHDRGATLKKLLIQGGKRYLKPLNARYPILEWTPTTMVLGVVKQMVVDFPLTSSPPKQAFYT